MNNLRKKIIAYNNQDNQTHYLTREIFTTLKKNPKNFFLVETGYVNPDDVLPCWYVDENARIDAVKNQKPFCDNSSTNEYFKIINRLDNSFIEGYLGRTDHEITYHDNFISNLNYFIDYNNRKKIYFTFDKISLYQVIEIIPENPLKFILKRLDNPKAFKKNQAFMIMPFHDKELDKFYFDNIKPFLKTGMDIDIYRADDFRDNDIIIETIYNLIEDSEFIIAETTNENKNAFYELGFASAVGKEIITIQNKKAEQKLFFDRAHIRAILYDPMDTKTFHFDLESTIKSIRARH